MDSTRFVDRLLSRIEQVGSPVCIGLDPVIDRVPMDVRSMKASTPAAIELFCTEVIDATHEFAAAFKPQSACFERLGPEGSAVLARVIQHARTAGVPVILDAKRGDIGTTAEHYAEAALTLGADAITVNAYLGPETVKPYLEAGLGVFALVRTSNPDSDEVQSCALEDGRSVAQMMAGHVAAIGREQVGERGMSDVGAVVGLTKAADGAALREIMPEQVFLVPGYGVQGGGASDLAPLLTGKGVPGRGVIVNASRSVIYARVEGGERWQDAVRRAAQSMREDLSSALS